MATVSHHCISQTKFSQAMLWEFQCQTVITLGYYFHCFDHDDSVGAT